MREITKIRGIASKLKGRQMAPPIVVCFVLVADGDSSFFTRHAQKHGGNGKRPAMVRTGVRRITGAIWGISEFKRMVPDLIAVRTAKKKKESSFDG